ncbi:tetratricopeptide repeat protein [Haliangium ochraceum]|uniref:Tetratricopeptide repeat protein n=1 Tax=Haliangium ochraceum (strain DSM 14365 / JCM 11303 / SMP-2) TaxID=502025 RepID=D0LZD8_HALO1|nr:tetratricopeptide repeat protein [Haliangium ochraceum]ACY16400.1 Tetratricopeptide repeat protein [Haliangium ochraceum DSM 14365]
MKKKSDNRTGFPGGGDHDELDAAFDDWDDKFDGLFAEPTGVDGERAADERRAAAAPAATAEAGTRDEGDEQDEGEDLEIEIGDAADAEAEGDDLEIEIGGATDAEAGPGYEFELSVDDASDVEPDIEIALDAPEALGGLLGPMSDVVLDDIDDGDAESLPPPFEQDSGAFELPPEPAPAPGSEDEDEVFTSALRPRRESTPPPVAQPAGRPRYKSVMSAFESVADEADDDDDDDFDPFAEPGEGASSQVTKVVEVDESLLAAAVPGADTKKRRTRAPTIVRRDELERLRAERAALRMAGDDDDDDDDDFGGGNTQLLSQEQLESLADKSAAEAPVVAVDADFYDDIVIDDAADKPEGEGEGVEIEMQVDAPVVPPGRRVSAHVVRRDSLSGVGGEAHPKPVPRARRRRSRNSEQELASYLEGSRALDPESTLDLRKAVEDAREPGAEPSTRQRSEEIQAIIDRAAEELRSQRADRDETAPPVLDPGDVALPEDSFEDFELDWETEPATKPAETALRPDATAAMARRDPDAEALYLGLPPAVLPTGADEDWPALAIGTLSLPAESPAQEPEQRAATLASALLRYERVLADPGTGEAAARMFLVAGQLSRNLGALDDARTHCESALEHAPGSLSAARERRRVALLQGELQTPLQALEAEQLRLEKVEQQALGLYRLEAAMAHGERELAAGEMAALGDDGAGARRALAQFELALARGEDAEAAAALAVLARTLEADASAGDAALANALARVHCLLEERGGGDAASGFIAVASAGASTAWLSAAAAARRHEDGVHRLAQHGAGTPLDESEPGTEAFAAALAWRRSLWSEAAGAESERAHALQVAAAQAPGQAFLVAEAAALAAASGQHERAAQLYQQLAGAAPTEAEQAMGLARAGRHLIALSRDDEAVRVLERLRMLEPSDPATVLALEPVLERLDDLDALIALDGQTVAANPEGSVFERVRMARRMARSGREDKAIAEIEAGRMLAPEDPALQQALLDFLDRSQRTHVRAGVLAGLAEEVGAVLGPDTASWRAALAYDAHAREVIARQEAGEAAGEAAEPLRALREGALASALEAWNRVLDDEPDSAGAHVASIRLAQMLGDDDVLDDVLARAQSVIHDSGHAAEMALARVVAATGRPGRPPGDDPEGLEHLMRELATLAPEDPRPAFVGALLAAADERPIDAAQAYEERAMALGEGARAAVMRYRAAALYLEPGDDAGHAAVLFDEVLRVAPACAPAQELLRSARMRTGDISVSMALPTAPGAGDEAESATSAAVRGAGEDDFARVLREADACLGPLGEPERALGLYEQALHVRPEDDDARRLVAFGLRQAALRAPALERWIAHLETSLQAASERADDSAVAACHDALARAKFRVQAPRDEVFRHLNAAATAAPGRPELRRAVERAHIEAGRWDALLALYRSAPPGTVREEAALGLSEVHLAGILARPFDESREVLTRITRREPHNLVALFQLDAAARAAWAALVQGGGEHGADAAEIAARAEHLGTLESATAAAMAPDALAQAGFLTRAGESAAAGGRSDEARERFRQALEVAEQGDAGGYSAALFAWRLVALREALWLELAESAEREAALPEAEGEQAELEHLAAVVRMDAGEDPSGARAALQRVLALEPRHDDAFARMRALLVGEGGDTAEPEALSALLQARLDGEAQPEMRAYLHSALAELSHGQLGQRARAREHLRAALEIVPGSSDCLRRLADLCCEDGDWQDAAELLLRWVRLEPVVELRCEVFFRLGTLYADHLSDSRTAVKAFKQVLNLSPEHRGALAALVRFGAELGDYKLAIAACERLVRISEDAEAKVPHLKRLAELYQASGEGGARAERTLRGALDMAPESDAALRALIGFYRKRGDMRSIRVHLDRLAGTMRARIAERPSDALAYRVIARAMAVREDAGVEGSLAIARSAAELALALDADGGALGDGGGEQPSAERAAELSAALRGLATPSPSRLSGLLEPGAHEYLAPVQVTPAVRQFFAQLGDRIGKYVGAELRRYEVGRGQRLRDREVPAMAVFESVAAELGVDAPVLYVSDAQPQVFAVEPSQPISVILGASLLSSMDENALRFAAGKALIWAQTGLASVAQMAERDFGVFLVALLRQFEPEVEGQGVDMAAVEREAQKMRRLVPASMVQELHAVALGMMGEKLEPAALRAGILELGDRAGLLACGSIATATSVLEPGGDASELSAALERPAVAALVRYAVSDDHAALFRRLRADGAA